MHTTFQDVVVDYFRAVARKATNGNKLSFYLVGASRRDFQYMVVDYLDGPYPPCLKTLVCNAGDIEGRRIGSLPPSPWSWPADTGEIPAGRLQGKGGWDGRGADPLTL